METLKFGNGNWATKEGSTLAYNDENNNFKPLPFDFTRASTATYVDSDGLIKTAKQGEARIDYTDSSDGVLLLENSATNLITHSEDFSQWTLSNSGNGQTPILTSNYITYKGLNASRIVFDRTSASFSNISSIRGNDYTQSTNTFSIYIKSNISNVNIDFRLGASVVTYEITTEWKRMEFSGSDFYRSYFGLLGSSSDLHADLSIVAAQAEQGSYATSYIPTNGSAVTRIAETCSNSGNSEVFNDSEGVLFADIAALADDTTFRVFSISDGTTTNNVGVGYRTASNVIYTFVGSTINSSTNVTVNDITSNNKLAVKYKSGSFAMWINGFEQYTSSTAFSLSGLSELAFDNGAAAADFYGKTKQIGYYDTILTDLELETLTSYTSWVSMVNALKLNIIYNG